MVIRDAPRRVGSSYYLSLDNKPSGLEYWEGKITEFRIWG